VAFPLRTDATCLTLFTSFVLSALFGQRESYCITCDVVFLLTGIPRSLLCVLCSDQRCQSLPDDLHITYITAQKALFQSVDLKHPVFYCADMLFPRHQRASSPIASVMTRISCAHNNASFHTGKLEIVICEDHCKILQPSFSFCVLGGRVKSTRYLVSWYVNFFAAQHTFVLAL